MSTWTHRLIGATLGAIAAMSIGGATYAFAQTADDGTTTTPPTTEAPAETPAPPPAPDREDCPEKAGRGAGESSSTAEAGEV